MQAIVKQVHNCGNSRALTLPAHIRSRFRWTSCKLHNDCAALAEELMMLPPKPPTRVPRVKVVFKPRELPSVWPMNRKRFYHVT